MVRIAARSSFITLLVISAALGMAASGYAQSATGAVLSAESSTQKPIRANSAPTAFGKLQLSGEGQSATSGTCVSTTCPTGDFCGACFSWSGMPLTGGFNGGAFSAPSLTGEFTLDNSKATTSGAGIGLCFPAAGAGTVFANAAKTNSIQIDIIGQLCASNGTNANFQFLGSYLVTGGTGGDASAAGSGTFTADVNNFFTTSTHTVRLIGTMSK